MKHTALAILLLSASCSDGTRNADVGLPEGMERTKGTLLAAGQFHRTTTLTLRELANHGSQVFHFKNHSDPEYHTYHWEIALKLTPEPTWLYEKLIDRFKVKDRFDRFFFREFKEGKQVGPYVFDPGSTKSIYWDGPAGGSEEHGTVWIDFDNGIFFFQYKDS